MKYFLTIATTVVILIAVLLPGSSLPDVGSFGLDKIIHFLLFFGWAIAVRYDFPTTKKFVGFIVGILFSFATEILQLFTEDRSFDVFDMLADSAGLLVGVLTANILLAELKKYFPFAFRKP